MQYYLAVDIGASSGRHIVGWMQDGRMRLEEAYRFENNPKTQDGALCWDAEDLFRHILAGMKACKAAGKIPSSMGIDTWGVDFVLLDAVGNRIGEAVCYRDARTDGMDAVVESSVSVEELFRITGIAKQPFNTIYQLMALQQKHPDQLARAERFLMMPEYFHYLLTGVCKNEYTNATTTALVDAREKAWSRPLLEKLGYPAKIFGGLHKPGEEVGGLRAEIVEQVGFDCQVILPATHDTGSAYLAVPARDENAVYLSSGTWSLLGVESVTPILGERARAAGFTNEGGYDYRYRVLQNIMGLWMIQSIRRNLGKQHSFPEMIQMAREAEGFASVVDVNDKLFLAPENMIEAVKEGCRRTGQSVPQTLPQVMQCVYRSLAACYANAVRDLQGITGRSYTSMNIVGGGSQDGYLNQMTATATGLTVYAGPTEGTVIGNLIAQMISSGELSGIEKAREVVRDSFEMKEYQPIGEK